MCGLLNILTHTHIHVYSLLQDEPPPLPSDMPPVPEQFAAPSETPPPIREPLVEKPTEKEKEPIAVRSPVRQAPPPPPSSAPPQEPTHEQPLATATKEAGRTKKKSFFKFGSKK